MSSDDSKNEEVEKKSSSIVMNVTDTQYEIVKYVGTVIMEWQLSFDPEFNDWDVNWVDLGITPE